MATQATTDATATASDTAGAPGDADALPPGDGVSMAELGLATRNHGLPLEALRYDVTPVGLHYLLTHYDIPAADPDTWALEVGGAVGQPVSLSLADLRALPAVTRTVTMECAGNGRALMAPRPPSQPWVLEAVGTGSWTGVPLADLLGRAGVGADAVEVLFTGADRGVENGVEQAYQRSLTVADALGAEALVAYDLNGAPLPPQHGAPLRLVVPGWYGMTSVKWLRSIVLLTEPFDGYQQAWAYRLRQDAGEEGVPLSRIEPRSLMVPPGIPEFFTRERSLPPGPVTVTGRAWSGYGPVTEVAVSTDGGATWVAADVDPAGALGAWQGWRCTVEAVAGDREFCARATDATGRTQPLDTPWNLGGYANNAVHRVPVHVA